MASAPRPLPGGEFYDGADLKWSLTGASHKNAVFGARLTAQNVPARVQQVQAHFAQRNLEYFAWVIDPSTQPADLGEQLVERYGAHALDGRRSIALAGMTLERDRLPQHILNLPAVRVERVTTAGALDEARQRRHQLAVTDATEMGHGHYQRRGYGRQAIQAAIAMLAKEHGYQQFALSYSSNNNAKHLYQQLGFIETNE